jgi:CRISPR-associated protein Csb2
MIETIGQQYHRWSQPPGSQRVVYWRRSAALEVGVPQRPTPRRVHRVHTMLLALNTPSGSLSALPSVTRTLPQAELFHRAIVGRLAKGERVDSPELTGKDRNGRPLREGHRHAHVLPVDLDADGRLDHIIVYAPMGLGDAAQQAVRTLRRTWTKGGVGDLQLALAGSGNLDMLRSLPAPLDSRVEQLLGPRQGSRIWMSATPFVPPRFLKPRGANTLIGQINAELASRGLPTAESVRELPRSGETVALRHFIRVRQRGGTPPPGDIGYALRLQFGEPIRGPLSLGYASHFGLGLFRAEVS